MKIGGLVLGMVVGAAHALSRVGASDVRPTASERSALLMAGLLIVGPGLSMKDKWDQLEVDCHGIRSRYPSGGDETDIVDWWRANCASMREGIDILGRARSTQLISGPGYFFVRG